VGIDALISLWQDTAEDLVVPEPKPATQREFDVAIIGAGFSGLWTAYYLKKMDPAIRLAIFESQQVGFGASGRNGGWVSGLLPMSLGELEKMFSRSAAIEMYRQSFATIDEIEHVVRAEQIDCGFHRGGTLNGATNAVQAKRVRDEIEEARRFGLGEEHHRLISSDEMRARLNVPNLVLASYTPHCAVVHPLRLVRGLAKAVLNLGVEIFENSHVDKIRPRQIRTANHECRAEIIVRATEGYTAQIADHRRLLAPLYSYMVATAPLSAEQIARLNWKNRETYHDARNMIIYSQLTADNRIAFGGRGAPYHFASRVKPDFDTNARIHDKIIRSMNSVFPVSTEVAVTHRWGGPLGVPRNWQPSVNYDKRSGLASLGGYVGDGVAAANLAARTLAHLIREDDHDLTRLAWVNHPSRNWEIEPLRFVGINGLIKLSESIDKHERRTGKPDRIRETVLKTFLG